MGQAQSMSSGGSGCEGCPVYPGYLGSEVTPDKSRVQGPLEVDDRYVQKPAGTDTPGIARFETRPGIMQPVGLYPGGIIPSGQTTHPAEVIPGVSSIYRDFHPGTRPELVGMYPGISPSTVTPQGVQSGVAMPGHDKIHLGNIRPGIMIPGIHGTYPERVRPGITTTGIDGRYPEGIRSGTMPTGDIPQPGILPPESTPTEDVKTYPGNISPKTLVKGDIASYPGSIQSRITSTVEGIGAYPGIISPTSMTTGDVRTYPGSIRPGVFVGEGTYSPGSFISSSVTAGAGIESYQGGIVPAARFPGAIGIYPNGSSFVPSVAGGTYSPGINVYPDAMQPGTAPTSVGVFPHGVIPGGTANQKVYPGTQQTRVIYPGGTSDTLLNSGVNYPGSSGNIAQGHVPGVVTSTGSVAGADTTFRYSNGQPSGGQIAYSHPGSTTLPGKLPDGKTGISDTPISVSYPGGIYPGGSIMQTIYPGNFPPHSIYSPGTQQTIYPSAAYPGQRTYPIGSDVIIEQPIFPDGQYPRTSAGIPGRTSIRYPTGTIPGQTTITGARINGQYPGQYSGRIDDQGTNQYLTKPYTEIGRTAGVGENSQYYTQPSIAAIQDEDAESQATSSVQQINSGTQASATAQGKYGNGTAKSQVTGTYNGSGSFSAQAGTSDANKNAQVEISGGKEGATSNAQGIAGHGKSQAQVQLDSDSGATLTGAQSSGWKHGTNSQVQASSNGGMADAQANGEGSTSSQAQIGFQPYLKNSEKLEKHAKPFHGSGTASAQSGTHRGQSQSQLQGSFRYGITYTGAAQAGSGSGAASSRKPFNFTFTDTELFKPVKPQNSLKMSTDTDSPQKNLSETAGYGNKQDDSEQGLQSSSTSQQEVIINSAKIDSKDIADKKIVTEKSRIDDNVYDDYDNEYADEDYDSNPVATASKISSDPSYHELNKTAQQQSHQLQIEANKGKRYDIYVSQDSNISRVGDILQPGQSLSGFTIPPGFRGRVISTSDSKTVAQDNGKSQMQTVSLKNSSNIKSPNTETRSLSTSHERYANSYSSNIKNQGSFNSYNASLNNQTRAIQNVAVRPNYYTVSNSIAGKMNGNTPRKYEHRYYTKSSTCGYFTFSCNAVYGSNGRTKICKPKVPTYPDGTPMKC